MRILFCRISKEKFFIICACAFIVNFILVLSLRTTSWWANRSILTVQIGSTNPAEVTIVTQYFKLKKSKHGLDEYEKWQYNFFNSVSSSPLIVYTDRESLAGLVELSKRTTNSKTFYVFDSIWNITKLIEQDRYAHEYVNMYRTKQHAIDPERKIHSPELYAIWNAKPFMMKRSAINNVYNSKFFIYTDVGAFRYHIYPDWPDTVHVNKLSKRLKDRVLFGRISSDMPDPYYFEDNNIQGTFFAGSPAALKFYYNKFYDIHDEMLKQEKFVGKDQTIMNVFALVLYPRKSCQLWLPDRLKRCISSYDVWFIYQFFFSNNHVSRIDSMYEYKEQSGYEDWCVRRKNSSFVGNESVKCSIPAEHIGIPTCFECDI